MRAVSFRRAGSPAAARPRAVSFRRAGSPAAARPRACAVVVALALASLEPSMAYAQEQQQEADAPPIETHPKKEEPFENKPGYAQIFATMMGGTGLRFNNPYRLSTPIGSDAESVSRTAAYIDIGLAMTLGNPLGFQHGVSLRTTVAVEGVGQVVMTPSYFGWRRVGALAAYGRAGLPIVVTPDVTMGFEAALGGAFFFLGGVGAVAEIAGDLYYGTGTREVRVATYPVLSMQLGIIGTYEVLP